MGSTKAEQLIDSLRAGWELLVKESSRFENYDLMGGVSCEDYIDLKHFTCRYLQACKRTPHARIELSSN